MALSFSEGREAAWSLFSDLVNDVVGFCVAQGGGQFGFGSSRQDRFEVRVIRGPVSLDHLKGTVYERRIELTWWAHDMPSSYLGRHHWEALRQGFSRYDLRARVFQDRWKAEMALPPPGRLPVAVCLNI